jgi:hypothetical protein
VVLLELGKNRFRLELSREELDQFIQLLGRSTGTALQQGETALAQSLMRFAAALGLDPL